MTDEADAGWQFVYMRNIDISRVPKEALASIWDSLGIDCSSVACSSMVGAYLAEFIVCKDYVAQFIAKLTSIRTPDPLDASLSVSVDTDYSPIAPHAHIIPDTCAVPQPALDALNTYARESLAKRWGSLYHASAQPGVRQLIRQSLAKHALELQQPSTPLKASRLGAPLQPFCTSDIVRHRAPNHAILSKDHLAELIPQPTATRLVTYTDGAYLPERGTAGIGAYFANTGIPPLALRLGGHQSTQCIWPSSISPPVLDDHGGWREIWVCTDSQYVVDAVNVFSETWRKANWLTAKGKPIANRTAFRLLFAEIQRLSARGYTVFVHHLPAHFGIAGNDIADTLAKA
ncbi:Ribonuclease H1, partial [Coemansia erecta]